MGQSTYLCHMLWHGRGAGLGLIWRCAGLRMLCCRVGGRGNPTAAARLLGALRCGFCCMSSGTGWPACNSNLRELRLPEKCYARAFDAGRGVSELPNIVEETWFCILTILMWHFHFCRSPRCTPCLCAMIFPTMGNEHTVYRGRRYLDCEPLLGITPMKCKQPAWRRHCTWAGRCLRHRDVRPLLKGRPLSLILLISLQGIQQYCP